MSRDRRYRLPRERVYFPRSLTIFTIAARYARNTVKGDVTPRCIMPRQKAAVRAYSRNYSCQLLFLERPSSPARLRALASLKLEFMGRGLTAATLALTISFGLAAASRVHRTIKDSSRRLFARLASADSMEELRVREHGDARRSVNHDALSRIPRASK